MTYKMKFTVEHEYEYEFAVVEGGKVVRDDSGEAVLDIEYECVEREYQVPLGFDPGQRGGWDDPSWDPYAYLDGDITPTDGLPADITPEVEEAAEDALKNEEFGD